MKNLKDLDRGLSKLKKQFQGIAHGVTFTYVCSLADSKQIAEQIYRGIYLIEIQTAGPRLSFSTWRTQFEVSWNAPLLKHAFTPSTKKKRMDAHSSLKSWMPLYIGKSKKIFHRIGEHVALGLADRTFALKLNLRPQINLRHLRLSTVDFDKLGIRNYDVVAPKLERALREMHNPVVGQ
jgi:hypothetical protein